MNPRHRYLGLGTFRIQDLLLYLLTFSYHGALDHYTLLPMAHIRDCQSQGADALLNSLRRFKRLKIEELRHVQGASTLSAAATIGALSWSATSQAYWLCRLFWYCSLWLSVFALISSSQHRLLSLLPGEDTALVNKEGIPVILDLLLESAEGAIQSSTLAGSPSLVPDGPITLRAAWADKTKDSRLPTTERRTAATRPQRQVSVRMRWIWQTPTMLMSWSWVTFLLGFAVLILTPLIEHETWTEESTVAVAAMSCATIVIINFFLSAFGVANIIRRVQNELSSRSIADIEQTADTKSLKNVALDQESPDTEPTAASTQDNQGDAIIRI